MISPRRRSRQLRLYHEHRAEELCALCSRPAVYKMVYDPTDSRILQHKALGFCAKHWAQRTAWRAKRRAREKA